MFGFILKKNFCDGWDNLISVIISNLVFLFSGIGLVLLNGLAGKTQSEILSLLAIIFSVVVLSILTFAYSDSAAHIANFDGIRIMDFFKAIPGSIKDGALFGLMNAGVFLISSFSIRYYIVESGSLLGFGLGCAIFWVDFFYILAMQWFIPIRALMIFSVVCIGFFPSMSGLLIANTNALRVLLYKYDYLEEHPELKTRRERRMIPWDDLLAEDRDILGPRPIRSFLFPWKDDKQQNF